MNRKTFKIKNYKGNLIESLKKFQKKYPKSRIVEATQTSKTSLKLVVRESMTDLNEADDDFEEYASKLSEEINDEYSTAIEKIAKLLKIDSKDIQFDSMEIEVDGEYDRKYMVYAAPISITDGNSKFTIYVNVFGGDVSKEINSIYNEDIIVSNSELYFKEIPQKTNRQKNESTEKLFDKWLKSKGMNPTNIKRQITQILWNAQENAVSRATKDFYDINI